MENNLNKFMSVVLVIILASCSTTSQFPTAVSSIKPTVTLFPTVAPILPIPSFTSTSSPTLTSIATPISLPSRIPLPTLGGEKDFLDFISFTGNKDCKLPCWAGIVPGNTHWDDALFALAPITSLAEHSIYLSIDGRFGKTNSIDWFFSSKEIITSGYVSAILSNQSIVKLVNMKIEGSSPATGNTPSRSLPLPQRFKIPSVLREYGIPSMIFIYSFVHDQPTPIPFQILLVYPDNHFYIKYYRDAKLSGSNVEACNSEFILELLVVDSKDKLVSIDAIANTPEINLNIQSWKPVDQALNISPEEFYNIYSVSSPGCMNSPSNLCLP